MSLSVVYSRACIGVDAPQVSVEVHLSNGLPGFTIVGLPEAAVRESKDRVRSAILNANFKFPAKRITVNLAPADIPKEGCRFDLAIALGLLSATEQLEGSPLDAWEFYGELALSGTLRPISGLVPALMAGRRLGKQMVVPGGNVVEASLVASATIYSAGHLLELVSFLAGQSELELVAHAVPPDTSSGPDMQDVRGQQNAKRALMVAAAGGHSLLMVGPPGSGKTMLASRLPGVQPDLTEDESLEVAAIHSLLHPSLAVSGWNKRPFRRPHHSSSAVALVGGGTRPRPGEISLAHLGVLFLDELPEFSRHVLEQLREPMEAGEVHIARASQQVVFPARFQLVAAMNPCPCGYLGDDRCTCTMEQVRRYRDRVSGPLMDRIDIHIEVPPVSREHLSAGPDGEPSVLIQAKMVQTRQRQLDRQACLNHELAGVSVEKFCRLDEECKRLLGKAMEQLGLSARAYHRILRMARTVADLEPDPVIQPSHIAEAIGYRMLDRNTL